MSLQKYNNIMIDTETLATGADAVILSLGAVKFTTDGRIDDKAFYVSISIDSQLKRKISESTINWWMDQDAAARAVFKEKKVTLESALHDFAEWIDHASYKVWSNGADFDIPLIRNAMEQYDIQVPWEFWNQRCFRTLKSEPPGVYVPAPVLDTAHNALDDALNQVKHLHAIYAAQRPGAAQPKGSFVKSN